MPSKNGTHKSRRSPSTSSSACDHRKSKRQSAKVESRKRRCSSSSERSLRKLRKRCCSSSSGSSSKKRKKFRPRKRSKSKSPVKPSSKVVARLPFGGDPTSKPMPPKAEKVPHASAKAKPTNGAQIAMAPGSSPSPTANGSPTPSAGSSAKAPASKLDLSSLVELQKKLDGDKNRLELFVIKAKREHDEKRESKEKQEKREKEYFHAELGMPCGPENRFLIDSVLGKGVFSTVYSAKDMGHKGKEFAIKFIRSDPMCRRATEKEVKLMRRLRNEASVQDPEGARCLMGLGGMEMFEHEGHLAVVLQLMKCDLRVGLRRFGQGNGLPLPFVYTFARDIFLALRALRSIKIVHTDLKPDNLLISVDRTSVKLSDFGSAMDVAQAGQVHTDYLQPRFYRAPEVIMGQQYTTQIDMWSAGATLYELATDRALFEGKSNNGMLHAMLKTRGPFSKKLATSGKFASKHFAENGDFLKKEKGSESVETVGMSSFSKPSPSLRDLLEESAAKQAAAEGDAKTKVSVRQLADLISKCCTLDPTERATPKDALAHAFIDKGEKPPS